MPSVLGFALVTHDRARVWCGPGLWPWSRLPRPPTFFASRHQAQTAAGALYRAHTTPPLLVVRLSTP
jgi:hypothetical protein